MESERAVFARDRAPPRRRQGSVSRHCLLGWAIWRMEFMIGPDVLVCALVRSGDVAMLADGDGGAGVDVRGGYVLVPSLGKRGSDQEYEK